MSKLKVVPLRGDRWADLVPRWPESMLLNATTDLNLVDLPGTKYMTSRGAHLRMETSTRARFHLGLC